MNSFKPVSNRPNFNQIESEIIKFWRENKIFEKSIELRESAEEFTFFEGPPTANGKPGVHHVLARTFKDLVCRYQTMKGKKVVRNAGWDEHGLPVEIEVEKSQGFTNERSKKEQIEELGIERFNELCAESTKKYIDEWEKLTERMAYWVNFENAYKTSSPQYIEKVWSILKSLNNKNLLYKGNKVVPWACDSGTVVSQAEVAQGYKDVIDESAYVKFKLTESSTKSLKEKFSISAEDESPIYMLAWTTTPWTLPSNMALAIAPDIEYVICKNKESNEYIIISQKRWKAVLGEIDWEVAGSLRGKELLTRKENKWIQNSPKNAEKACFKNCIDQTLISVNFGNNFEFWDSVKNDKDNSDKFYSIEMSDIPAFMFEQWRKPVIIKDLNTNKEFKNGEIKASSSHGIKRLNRQIELESITYSCLFSENLKNEIVSGKKSADEIFVEDSETSGTGIVHIAPAFGQDDFECYQANGIEDNIICAVSPSGVFNEQAPDFLKGQSIFNDNKKTGLQEFVRINKIICKELAERGLLLKTEKYEHSYPHNWRTNNPLIYYLRPSWYVATSKVRDELIAANKNINWYPEHIKEGRFGQWLENNIDWSISRERFWGTPLPIWFSERRFEVIGSFAELEEKINNFNPSQKDLLAKIKENPHKPLIDQLEWEEYGDKFKRVPEVLDCWFDSGSMPVAAFGTEPENFKTADYICEAIDQTRGWFYSLLAIAVSLSCKYDERTHETEIINNLRSPYKNVLCLGHILDKDGQKMSKSKGNVLNPWDLFEKFGADPVRWYMISAVSAGQPIKFDIDGISEVMRRFILPLWNTYSFFVLYANLDKITALALEEAGEEQLKKQVQPIDIWITARLNQTQKQINEEFEKYEFAKVAQLIEKFVDDLSNVWVRSNRSRFWNVGNSLDYSAYLTLHTCLMAVAKMSAPFAPLISEEIYQNLKSKDGFESIHLSNWAEADELTELENNLLEQMESALEIINIGRSLRQEAKIKIRQPLAQIFVADEFNVQYFADLILQELNIKELLVIPASELENNLKAQLNTEISPELKAEGLAREFIHSVQNLRKSSGFEVSDRIEIKIDFMNNIELAELIKQKKEYIMNEVLALAWLEEVNINTESKKIKLDGFEISLQLSKINY